METLANLSKKHLNESLAMISENTRLTNIAEVTKDKNALLKLRFDRQQLQKQYDYWKTKVEAGE